MYPHAIIIVIVGRIFNEMGTGPLGMHVTYVHSCNDPEKTTPEYMYIPVHQFNNYNFNLNV